MRFAGLSRFGRLASWFAAWFTAPYFGRGYLASLNPNGFVSHKAVIHHSEIRLGANIFIGDGVTIFQDCEGGPVEIGDRVYIFDGNCIQTGYGGSVKIGNETGIQPRCQFSAYKSPIYIGRNVQIAPNCAFFPYDHSFEPGKLIAEQPVKTKGGITVEDDVWLGFGVIVLDGVRIGKGAVIGAGSVVTHDIPDGAIAVGVPARVAKMRAESIK